MTRSARLLLLLALAGCSVGSLAAGMARPTAPMPDPGPSQSVSLSRETPAQTYLLLGFDGQIGVFVPENTKSPLRLTGIPLAALPQADRELLRRGISASGPEELAALLEDFGS